MRSCFPFGTRFLTDRHWHVSAVAWCRMQHMNRLLIGAGDPLPLLRHLIQRDLPAGVTVIDPDGWLAEAIADSVPEELTEQTHYFDPSDAKHIASFNVLEGVLEPDRPKLVQDLCAFFDALFPAGAQTLTRQYGTYVLANVLTILLDSNGVSFLSVLEFLRDKTFRQQCLERSQNPIALRNWAAIEEWDSTLRKQAFANVETKVGTLLLSPVMRRTLQDRPTFHLRKTPIFIANLSRQKLGDSAARLLGTLLISRAATPLYINDFGFFASDHLTSLFSSGGYTVTLRSLSELSKTTSQAVLRFEDKYAFSLTPDDAETLQPYISGVLNPDVLVDMAPNEFRPDIDLDAPAASGRLKAVRRRSNARHARPAKPPQKKALKPRRKSRWP